MCRVIITHMTLLTVLKKIAERRREKKEKIKQALDLLKINIKIRYLYIQKSKRNGPYEMRLCRTFKLASIFCGNAIMAPTKRKAKILIKDFLGHISQTVIFRRLVKELVGRVIYM